MSTITSINPDLLSIYAALAAIIISQDRNADDLNIIGNFIVSVGSLILTEAAEIATQAAKKDNEEEIKSINQQIANLHQQLERMQKRYN